MWRAHGAGGRTTLGEEGRMKTQPTIKAKFLANFKTASVDTFIDDTPIDCFTENVLRSRIRATLSTTNYLSSVFSSE
jgi:hypothetical protein